MMKQKQHPGQLQVAAGDERHGFKYTVQFIYIYWYTYAIDGK